MPYDFKPLCQVELEVLLGGRAKETAPPAAAFAMGDGLADGAAGREEEEVDVRVYLGNDAEVDIEMEIQGAERNVSAERTVFPFVAEGVGC